MDLVSVLLSEAVFCQKCSFFGEYRIDRDDGGATKSMRIWGVL
jgi:hypothetical protein